MLKSVLDNSDIEGETVIPAIAKSKYKNKE
jgi:hypothetical protein